MAKSMSQIVYTLGKLFKAMPDSALNDLENVVAESEGKVDIDTNANGSDMWQSGRPQGFVPNRQQMPVGPRGAASGEGPEMWADKGTPYPQTGASTVADALGALFSKAKRAAIKGIITDDPVEKTAKAAEIRKLIGKAKELLEDLADDDDDETDEDEVEKAKARITSLLAKADRLDGQQAVAKGADPTATKGRTAADLDMIMAKAYTQPDTASVIEDRIAAAMNNGSLSFDQEIRVRDMQNQMALAKAGRLDWSQAQNALAQAPDYVKVIFGVSNETSLVMH